MNFIECHCAHSLYGNHRCNGILVVFSIDTRAITVCQACKQHILTFDQNLTFRSKVELDRRIDRSI